MANDKISNMTAAAVAALTGTGAAVEVSTGIGGTPATKQGLLRDLRTAMFAGGTGYTASDPLTAGVGTLSSLTVSGLSTLTGGVYNASDMVYNVASTKTHQWQVNAVEQMRLDASGNLLVGKNTATSNGGVIQTSNGLTFPATQSACSDANTLDDYEEGTWTPAASGASAITYDNQVGKYTKVGRLVTVTFLLQAHSVTWTSDSATFTISGLPFAGVGISYSGVNSYGSCFVQSCAFSGAGNNNENITTTALVVGATDSSTLILGTYVSGNVRANVVNQAWGSAVFIDGTVTYYTT